MGNGELELIEVGDESSHIFEEAYDVPEGALDEYVVAEICGAHCLIVASCFEGFSKGLLQDLRVRILGRKTGIDFSKMGPIHSVEKFRGRFRKRVGKVAQLRNRL